MLFKLVQNSFQYAFLIKFYFPHQITDYAKRKNVDISVAEKWLSSNLAYELDWSVWIIG